MYIYAYVYIHTYTCVQEHISITSEWNVYRGAGDGIGWLVWLGKSTFQKREGVLHTLLMRMHSEIGAGLKLKSVPGVLTNGWGRKTKES